MTHGRRDARPALAAVLLLGSALFASTATSSEPASAATEVTSAVSAGPAVTGQADEGMTPGRVVFLALGGAGVLVLGAALRAPGGRPAHRARRRRVPHDRSGGRTG